MSGPTLKEKFCTLCYYLNHKRLAKDAHGIHSPFLFDLYNKVIINKQQPVSLEPVEELRDYLLTRNSFIDVHDFGTGANRISHMRRIKDIAGISVSGQKKCVMLYHLVQFIKPNHIIELGTSLGLTTMYLAAAAPDKKVHTVEGCSQTIAMANGHFEKLGFKNIVSTNATFDLALPEILAGAGVADFVFIDGNHSKEPTLRYFDMILPFANENTVLVLDDIHWSSPMHAAWQAIKSHPSVTLTVDLFQVGLVFFKGGMAKQDVVIKF